MISTRSLAVYEVCERTAAEIEVHAPEGDDEPNDWAWAALFGAAVGVLHSRFGAEAVRAAFEHSLARAALVERRRERSGGKA